MRCDQNIKFLLFCCVIYCLYLFWMVTIAYLEFFFSKERLIEFVVVKLHSNNMIYVMVWTHFCFIIFCRIKAKCFLILCGCCVSFISKFPNIFYNFLNQFGIKWKRVIVLLYDMILLYLHVLNYASPKCFFHFNYDGELRVSWAQ